MKDSWEGKFQNAGECEIRTGSLSFHTRLSKSFPHKKVAVNMGKIWLLLNLLGNQGSQRRSKNNLRGITIGIGPIRGINSLVLHPLLARDIIKSEIL